ncbi:MAG TPA: efflux RND transporter periplasmic adaptor subunit [Chitinophagaceae bacterium]|nr:efflux RND transporter periplasmic adaptor subunit [Chitinophagaceae bacterium]
MQNILKISLTALIAASLLACGSAAKDEKGKLGDMKVKLEKLKKDKTGLDEQIRQVEEQIAKMDPEGAGAKPKLVAITTIATDTFSHFIDLQGKIDALNVSYVAPRGQGGTVKAVYVKQGQSIRKGQLVLKLDDAVARQGLSVAQQQIAGLESQVKLRQSVYERQQNLWKQNIGTEVQVLQAKTEAEAAASQLNAARASVRVAQEQVNLSNVYSEISGTVDQVNVKVGEFFSPASAANPQSGISIVNLNDLKILVQVPENYLGRVKEGSILEVTLPEAKDKTFNAKVTVVGKLIDPNSRSFYVEARIPANKNLHPNQIAIVKIRDYTTPEAITIPVNTLQNDEKGKYVMTAATEGGKLIARKRAVVVGELYGDNLEVLSGLKVGDTIITSGFQNLYEGQLLTTEIK